MKSKFVLIFIIASFILAIASAQQYEQYENCPMGSVGGMMYGFSGGYGTSTMLFSWIIGVLVIIALIVLIFWIFTQINKNKKYTK
jgi:hypothetical protein